MSTEDNAGPTPDRSPNINPRPGDPEQGIGHSEQCTGTGQGLPAAHSNWYPDPFADDVGLLGGSSRMEGTPQTPPPEASHPLGPVPTVREQQAAQTWLEQGYHGLLNGWEHDVTHSRPQVPREWRTNEIATLASLVVAAIAIPCWFYFRDDAPRASRVVSPYAATSVQPPCRWSLP